MSDLKGHSKNMALSNPLEWNLNCKIQQIFQALDVHANTSLSIGIFHLSDLNDQVTISRDQMISKVNMRQEHKV